MLTHNMEIKNYHTKLQDQHDPTNFFKTKLTFLGSAECPSHRHLRQIDVTPCELRPSFLQPGTDIVAQCLPTTLC